MCKNDWKVVGGILVGAIFVAYLINVLLSIDGFIPSAFSSKDWFGFWTNYTTGVFAVIVGYLAISFSNRNSERALRQQNMLLLKQDSDKIKEEIVKEIRIHNSLFNILDHCVTFIAINHDDIPGLNARVMHDRAKVNECRLNWNFIKQMYLSSHYLEEVVEEYDKCWGESVSILDEFLVLQTNLLLKVQEQGRAVHSIGLYDQILVNQKLKKNLSCHIDDEELEKEIQDTINGRDEQLLIKESCVKEIDEMISKSKTFVDRILAAQDALITVTICLLSKLNEYVFVHPDE